MSELQIFCASLSVVLTCPCASLCYLTWNQTWVKVQKVVSVVSQCKEPESGSAAPLSFPVPEPECISPGHWVFIWRFLNVRAEALLRWKSDVCLVQCNKSPMVVIVHSKKKKKRQTTKTFNLCYHWGMNFLLSTQFLLWILAKPQLLKKYNTK